MFRVKGTNLVIAELDLWVTRRSNMLVTLYRRLIWSTLRELVLTTPQWSGHAAANWNIGVGRPDNEVHDWSFRQDFTDPVFGDDPKRMGDKEAWQAVRARYGGGPDSAFMKQIQRGTKVYFCNGVYGDKKWGDDESVLYLAEVQSGTWSWGQRLREANLPYESAEEVIFRMDAEWGAITSKGTEAELAFGRIGGNAVNPEFV